MSTVHTIYEPGDRVITMAEDGTPRHFMVLKNGDLVLESGPKTESENRLPMRDVDPDRTAVMQAPQMPIDDGAVRDGGIPGMGAPPTAEDVLRGFVALQLQGSSRGELSVRASEVFRYKDIRLSVRYLADERRWVIRWP